MWIATKTYALNSDRLKRIYVKERYILADKNLVFEAFSKEEAKHIFDTVLYFIDIGYGKIDVDAVAAEYRKAQEKKHQMESAADGKQ